MRPRIQFRPEREARVICLFEAKNPLDAANKFEKRITAANPQPQSPEEKKLAEKMNAPKPDAEKNREKTPTAKELLDAVVKKFGELQESASKGLQKRTEQVSAVDQKVATMKTPDENRKETIDHRAAVKRADLFLPIGRDTEVVDASGAKEEDTSKPKVQTVSEPTPKQEVAQAPKKVAPEKLAPADAAKTEQLVQKQTPKPKVESPEATNVERENT